MLLLTAILPISNASMGSGLYANVKLTSYRDIRRSNRPWMRNRVVGEALAKLISAGPLYFALG